MNDDMSLQAVLELQNSSYMRVLNATVRATNAAMASMGATIGNETAKGTNRAEQEFKDFERQATNSVRNVGNVVTGILISRAFYAMLQTVSKGTKEVFAFAAETERAILAFTRFLGTEPQARRFVGDLEDMAALTPMQYEPLQAASRYLLAMGFSAREVIPTIKTLVDLVSAVGGDEQMFESVYQALGKIKAQGRITGKELRTLALANVPIYDILQKQLGLTSKQIINIARQNIDANTAIQAILRGISEDPRMAGMAEAMAKTFAGVTDKVADNLLLIGRDLTAGIFDLMKESLSQFGDYLADIRAAGRRLGIGGMLEAAFPKEFHARIRAILYGIQELSYALGTLYDALRPIGSEFMNSFTAMLAETLPILAHTLQALTKLIHVMASNETVAKALGSALAVFATLGTVSLVLGSITKVAVTLGHTLRWLAGIIGIAGVQGGLLGAFQALSAFVVANPMTVFFIALAAILLRLAASCDWVVAGFARMKAAIASFFGIDTSKMFQPKLQEEFQDGLDGTAGAIGDVGDEAEDAAKKMQKFLAPFDEIINMPDKTGAGAGAGGGGGLFDNLVPELDDWKLPSLELPAIQLPELDWSDWEDSWSDWWSALMGGLTMAALAVQNFNWPPFPGLPVESVVASMNALRAAMAAGAAAVAVAVGEMGGYVEGFRSRWDWVWDQVSLKATNAAQMQGAQASWEGARDRLTNSTDAWLGEMWLKFATWSAQTAEAMGLQLGVYNYTTATEAMTNTTDQWIQEQLLRVGDWLLQFAEQMGLTEAYTRLQESLTLFGASWILAIEAVRLTVSTWLTELANQFTLANAQAMLTNALNTMRGFWETHKYTILGIAGLLAAGVIAAFVSIPAGVATALTALVLAVTAAFADMYNVSVSYVSRLPNAFTEIKDKVAAAAQSVYDKIASIFSKPFKLAFEFFGGGGGGGGGGDYSASSGSGGSIIYRGPDGKDHVVPKGTTLPAGSTNIRSGAFNGAIINRRTVYGGIPVGEQDRREAIVPLENSTAMRPFAQAVAAEMGTSDRPVLMVGTLIASDDSLRELNRRFQVIQMQENERRGLG